MSSNLLIALLSAGVAGLALVRSVAADDQTDLRVMTFNLRYASDQPPNAWRQRRPVVRELIKRQSPDVIGTQEGLFAQIKDIATDLSDFTWIGLGRDGGSRGEFMAVFYRRERLEALGFDHFWLSDTPEVVGSSTWGNSNRRMVTWVRFLDRRTQREFYFFNTHFDHQLQPAREKSAALVLKRVEGLKLKLPLILVGDFNAAAGDNPVYDLLVGPDRFSDTWSTAQTKGEAIGTFHNYRGAVKDGPRIDWIVTRGPVACLSSEVVTYSQGGQFPSDHFPVVARLRIFE